MILGRNVLVTDSHVRFKVKGVKGKLVFTLKNISIHITPKFGSFAVERRYDEDRTTEAESPAAAAAPLVRHEAVLVTGEFRS